MKGGGVYSFSYLVLGPTVSFIAVASIIVDYVLTACLSTVSAVENGMSFIHISEMGAFALELGIIWFVAGLNIIGIKENAKFTFGIFIVAAVVLINLARRRYLPYEQRRRCSTVGQSFVNIAVEMDKGSWFNAYFFVVVGVSSCILAYSGIESVVQTASLVSSWKEIRKRTSSLH
jgi:amino acid transporter